MYSVGSRVRLVSQIGDYPVGREAVVVSVDPGGDVREIDLNVGRRHVIRGEALAPVEESGRARRACLLVATS